MARIKRFSGQYFYEVVDGKFREYGHGLWQYELYGNYLRKYGGLNMYVIDGDKVKEYSGLYILQFDGRLLRRYGGQYIAEVQDNKIRRWGGLWEYVIDGFITHKELMALLTLLYA